MNNEALNEFIKLMTETLKQAKDFTLAQAPEIMKEVIRVEIAQSVAGIVLGVVFFIVACRAHKFLQVKIKADRDKRGGSDWVVGYIVVMAALVGGIVTTCENTSNVLQAWLAPRVYLIEYFSHLVRK